MSLTPSPVSLERARDLATEIIASWRAELTSMAHSLWQSFGRDHEPVFVFSFDQNAIIVTKRQPGLPATSDVIERRSHEGSAGAIARIAQICDPAGSPREITLCFPESAVLRAQLAMPRTSRRNLVQALQYDLGRLSPLDPQHLYFDFAVAADGDRASKTQHVGLRITKRSEIDEAVRLSREAGLRVASINFEGDTRPADWRLFPIDRFALARSLWRRWNIAALAGLAVMLGLLLLTSAYARHVQIGQSLAEQVSVAQEQAAVVERLQEKLRTILAENRFLEHRKNSPMLVVMLAELSRTLPDGTWITQLTLDGNALQLQGYSQAASNLIGVLDRSSLFENAQFTAPLTQDARSNFERFDLSVDVRQAPR